MADYLILLLVGLVALYGGGWWVILVAAVGLSISPWHMIWLAVKRHPQLQNDWGVAVHALRAFCIGLAASAGAYILGSTMRVAP